MGKRGIRGLKTRVGWECCISREARLNSGGIHARGVRGGSHSATVRCNGGSHSVTSRDAAGENSSRSELPRALNLEMESNEHLRLLIWSNYSIAVTYPALSHFQRTLSKDRWVQGWDERYRSSREEERRRRA